VFEHRRCSPETLREPYRFRPVHQPHPSGRSAEPPLVGIVAGRKSPVSRAEVGECPADRRSAAPSPEAPGCAASCGRPSCPLLYPQTTSTWWLIPRGCKNVFEYQLYSGERVEERPLAHRGSAQGAGSHRRHSFQAFLPPSARIALRAKEKRSRADRS
jgi:hypothetical protein